MARQAKKLNDVGIAQSSKDVKEIGRTIVGSGLDAIEKKYKNIENKDMETTPAEKEQGPDNHFNSDIYGEPNEKEGSEYDSVTRDVVSEKRIEELATKYGLSVDEINSIINPNVIDVDIPSLRDDVTYSDALARIDDDKNMQVDTEIWKLPVDGEQDEFGIEAGPFINPELQYETKKAIIAMEYKSYMEGYDKYTAGETDDMSDDTIKMYGDVQKSAQTEVDTYLEAREALYNMKDKLSDDAYNKLVKGLIETNPTISESIGKEFPDSEENKIMCPEFESVLNGPDVQKIPDFEHNIDPGFNPKIPRNPIYQKPDRYFPGNKQVIQIDKSNDDPSLLKSSSGNTFKNMLNDVTDKVTIAGKNVMDKADNVVDIVKQRGTEFDDMFKNNDASNELDGFSK